MTGHRGTAWLDGHLKHLRTSLLSFPTELTDQDAPELDVDATVQYDIGGKVEKQSKVSHNQHCLENEKLRFVARRVYFSSDNVIYEVGQDFRGPDEGYEEDNEGDQGRCDTVSGVGRSRREVGPASLLHEEGPTQGADEAYVAEEKDD